MISFKQKKVGVLGLGIEGMSAVKFLAEKGAAVTILDQKQESQLQEELKEIKGVEAIGGESYLKDLSRFDVVVRSPGVKRNLPEILEAEKKGAVITSPIKIFFDLCPCPIIGVTGTKGKGTTSSLIYEMLKGQGLDVYLGGNIGLSPLEFLNKLNPHSWVVLELSSFQLQDLTKSPHIAVILMITSEHLDYHKDVFEYVDAKRNILRFQTKTDYTVINKDYLASRESDVHTQAKIFEVTREGEAREGCFVKGGKIILRNSLRSPRQFSRSAGSARAPGEFSEEEIIDTNDILLPGKHNLENVCSAVMAAKLSGVSKKIIANVLKTFKGLEHRLELVAKVDGVKYYDDSFSTTPETAIAAIEAFENPKILILGGSHKNSDFKALGEVINSSDSIKAIIGIGVEWERIKAQFKVQSSKFKVIEGLKNMKEVVVNARVIAEPGDVVLLSPACASFGMFRNYKERGRLFKEEVLRLISDST